MPKNILIFQTAPVRPAESRSTKIERISTNCIERPDALPDSYISPDEQVAFYDPALALLPVAVSYSARRGVGCTMS